MEPTPPQPTTPSPRHQPPRAHISAAVRRELERTSGGHCAICLQSTEPLEVDHIVPRSRGGTDDIENLRLVCRAFNRGGRCAALTFEQSRRRRRKLPTHPGDEDGTTTRPTLTVEIQISRQYFQHQLSLPGAAKPTYHRYLFQALEAAQAAGYETLTVVIDGTEYALSPATGET